MKDLIKINLNQTVSKTELKEKQADKIRWVAFYGIIILFTGLIIWQSILIGKSNAIISDQNALITSVSREIRDIKETGLKNFDEKRRLKPGDIDELKEFQTEKRIFWGPKLTALIDAVSEDMVVTNMELVNRKFKMTVYTRFDTINPSNTAYKKGKDFETRLKDSGFIDYFKKDSQGDPEFSAVKYEDDNIDGNKVHKIVFQGEIEKTLQKKRLRSKRRK